MCQHMGIQSKRFGSLHFFGKLLFFKITGSKEKIGFNVSEGFGEYGCMLWLRKHALYNSLCCSLKMTFIFTLSGRKIGVLGKCQISSDMSSSKIQEAGVLCDLLRSLPLLGHCFLVCKTPILIPDLV